MGSEFSHPKLNGRKNEADGYRGCASRSLARIIHDSTPFSSPRDARAPCNHVQRVIYLRDQVTLIGSVPVRRGTFQAPVPVPFRIDGELDRKAIQARPHNLLPNDGRWKKLERLELFQSKSN
jgi:hypothetical protein